MVPPVMVPEIVITDVAAAGPSPDADGRLSVDVAFSVTSPALYVVTTPPGGATLFTSA